MKTVQHTSNTQIKRVSDKEARKLVATYMWNYCPKYLWKALKDKKE